ncbi:MAG: DMT family transporter [Clostridiales bacterium]|nr:DMT family transporter [Clostridiales bacterium]
MASKELKATILLFLTSIIWGVSFVAQVVGMEYMRPFLFNGLSFLIGAASLVPITLIFDRAKPDAAMRRTLWKYGAVCGLLVFFAGNLQQFGVDLTGSAGKSGFITGLYIIIVPIAGIFMKRPAGKLIWAGAGIAVVGMYFLCVEDGLGSLMLGDGLLLLGACFWAAHIIAIDRFAPKVSALRLSMIQFVICGALCMIFAVLTEPVVPAYMLMGIAPLLYRGIGSIGVAYTLQVVGQRYVAPAKASVIFSLESVFSVVGGVILINEAMTGRAYFGCALIFCGIILSQLQKTKKPA